MEKSCKKSLTGQKTKIDLLLFEEETISNEIKNKEIPLKPLALLDLPASLMRYISFSVFCKYLQTA